MDLAGGRVCAGTDVDADLLGVGVGVLLALESLDVAVAVLVEVVDDPRLLGLAAARRPFPLPNRHGAQALL